MTGRFQCTEATPWDGKERLVCHHGAQEIADSQEAGWPCGDTVRMRCKFCNHEWTAELPQ
jgi:hypothetical protein